MRPARKPAQYVVGSAGHRSGSQERPGRKPLVSGTLCDLSALSLLSPITATASAASGTLCDLRLKSKPLTVTLRQSPVTQTSQCASGEHFMGSNVRHLTSSGRVRGKAALIAGTAAAMLCTGLAIATSIMPTPSPAAIDIRHNPQIRRSDFKPRPGGGRDAVLLGPGRRVAAGQLVPGRQTLDLATV